jgi:iron complex transport system substrate-binding protein
MRELDDITAEIVDASLKIHQNIGPGLLESAYERVLAAELIRRGLKVERQRSADFDFDGLHFARAFRLDLLVEAIVAVEIKSVERLQQVHRAQLLTYLRLMRLPLGLLINFGGLTLRSGLVRIVNNLPPSQSSRLDVNRHGFQFESDD